MSRIMSLVVIFATIVTCFQPISAEADNRVYKMCVPHKFYQHCLDIVKEPSQGGLLMECLPARDRMDCLEKVNKREADLIVVDPEDMYVAYHMNNQDFQVISEIRTQLEKDAEFRYEGVILIKKSSPVKDLESLRGLKSCHTGFGRNVGYKIPITKLKKHGVLKVSLDPELSPTERELKALSQFFSKSCLVGTYSPHGDVDQILKKKYANLCALCEKPQQCNYPDKYSGYEGAIRCLAEGQGDVAFTKTIFIKKYFGLAPQTNAQANPEDFEYLCEDGSRRPITGPACSWAQRPWQGYMTNSDAAREKAQLERLQKRVDSFYKRGQEAQDKAGAANLLIKPDLVLHEKKESIMPKEYLERAGYKDVIERDGSMTQKIRMCVTDEVALKKCNTMKQAAYSRDIRPEFQCELHSKEDSIKKIHANEADAVVLSGEDYKHATDNSLKPFVYEAYDDEDLYVAVVDDSISQDLIKKAPIKYDINDKRAAYAARLLNNHRGKEICNKDDGKDGPIEIMKARDALNTPNKKLICLNLQKKDLKDYKECNCDATLPNAVFTRANIGPQDLNNMQHAFISLSESFGHNGRIEDVFEMFDEFKPGNKNVLFSDDASKFVTELKLPNDLSEDKIGHLKCN